MSVVELSAELYAVQSLCKDLVAWSAYYRDQQDHEALAALFTETAQLTRPGGIPLNGRAEILASYRDGPAGRITRHLISNTVFLETTSKSAKSVSYVLLWSTSLDQPTEASGRKANPRRVLGEFYDEFAKTPQGWRIARRESPFIMYKE